MPGQCPRRRKILTMNLKWWKVLNPEVDKYKTRIRTGNVAAFILENSALKVFINTRSAWD